MSKIYRWITVAAAIMLLGGLVPNTVDASASAGAQENSQKAEKPNHQQKERHGYHHGNNFDWFLKKCFERWGIVWETDKADKEDAPEKTETEEQPNVNQPEQIPAPEPTPQPSEEENTEQQESQLNQFEQQVVDLTNEERAKYGLSALKVDGELSKVAREKSRDMQVNNYFDHNSPTYGSPFDMMQTYGIDYRSAGENIAKGQRSPAEVVNAWMNSEGHRANILNSSFTHIGVGYVEQGNVWTQQFIGK